MLNRYYSDYIEKTARIDKLKEALFVTPPEIEADRAVLLTESYQKTEGEPIIMRQGVQEYL